MDASESTHPSGESVSEASDAKPRLWRCRFCGNAVLRPGRPTKCYHCRRGESELQLNDERLFQQMTAEEVRL
jgi:rubrerythrin